MTYSSYCAAENGTCQFAGGGTVAYGANGTFYYQSFTDGTACSNTVFGDPDPGVAKACFYLVSAGSTHFQHLDGQSTERAVTSYNGSVEGWFTSLPFGDGYSASGSDSDPYHFAMLDKDYYGSSDSGTDHAKFRLYSDTQGRWMSPDPYSGSYDVNNPQSMNRYTYVLNNPLAYVDPEGLDRIRIGPCVFEVSRTSWIYNGQPDGSVDVIDYLIGCNDNDGNFNYSDGYQTSMLGGGGGGGGGAGPPAPRIGHIFTCASEFASKYSIAGGLHALGIGKSGVGGFITNALGGNAISGFTDLVQSFGSGSAGGHSVFYNMGQSLMEGPRQGIPGGSGPWGASASDVATGAIVGGAFSPVTGVGQSIQTLNGAASLASVGIDAVEDFATGVGFVKFGYDGLSYLAGLAHCAQ